MHLARADKAAFVVKFVRETKMINTCTRRLLIVGNPEPVHVGAHLLAAGNSMGLETKLADQRQSWSASRWLNRLAGRLAGRRPTRLHAFGREVENVISSFHPDLMVVTGIAAPDAATLQAVRNRGIWTANFLTDDPWNPTNRAGFFWAALREYDVVYSPRRANIDQLRQHGCRRVEYLPFAFNPQLHFPETPTSAVDQSRFFCDVVIVGGADKDRIPAAMSLANQGLRLRLYGGYWDRWPQLKPFYAGFASGRELRMAVRGATVNVCMVRRANRDGHAMRSLELPAMGGCIVVEDTQEHRELFGDDECCVEYYRTSEELAAKVTSLCAEPERARALSDKVYKRICCDSRHTYADRLQRILDDMKPSKPHG